MHEIRQAINFSMPLGNIRFQQQIERALGRKLGHQGLGRPKKAYANDYHLSPTPFFVEIDHDL